MKTSLLALGKSELGIFSPTASQNHIGIDIKSPTLKLGNDIRIYFGIKKERKGPCFQVM